MPSCKDSTNDDLSSHSLMESTEAHLLAAMQGMQALVKRQQPSVKPAWHKQLKAIHAALRFVHTAAGNEGAPASQGAVDPEQLRLFAQKLREQRKAIGLTQEQRIGQPSPPAAPPPRPMPALLRESAYDSKACGSSAPPGLAMAKRAADSRYWRSSTPSCRAVSMRLYRTAATWVPLWDLLP